jgi:hypothetical protein
VDSIELAQPPLAARAHNSTSDATRRGHAESPFVCVHSHEKNHHVTPGRPGAIPVHPLKIGSSFEPSRSWEMEAPLRQQPACAPCGGARGARCGRPGCACVPGIRGSFCACGYWVETFSS